MSISPWFPGTLPLVKRRLREIYEDHIFSIVADDDTILLIAYSAPETREYPQINLWVVEPMLLEFQIKNFAIISEILSNFEKGMTVLTGKQVQNPSLSMPWTWWGRYNDGCRPTRSPKAKSKGSLPLRAIATWRLSWKQGLEWTDGELIIRREICKMDEVSAGSMVKWVNLSVLKAVRQHLVDIHGQHDQEELMRPQLHIAMLDEFGGCSLFPNEDAYRRTRKTRLQTSAQTSDGTSACNQQENKARIEMLEFQIAEIEAAALKWMRTCVWSKNANACSITRWLQIPLTNAYTMLDAEEFSSLSMFAQPWMIWRVLKKMIPATKSSQASYLKPSMPLRDITKRLEDVVDGLGLMAITSCRWNLVWIWSTPSRASMVAKSRTSWNTWRKSPKNIALTGSDLSSEDLEKELKRLEKSLVTLAQDLSDQRHDLGLKIWKMKSSKNWQISTWTRRVFKCVLARLSLIVRGNEAVEFYISTNPGEDFKPLVKVASGGELSRLMLAIKSAFLEKKEKPVLSLTRWIQESLGAWLKPSQRKIHKIGQNGQVLAILTCLKSLLQQIINSILRKSVMNTQLSLLCVCSIEKNDRRNCQDAGRRGSNGSCPSTSRATSQALRERRFETMSTYFVVGDIHGKAQMLEELMTEWDGKAQLVFLGDLIDRGRKWQTINWNRKGLRRPSRSGLPFRESRYMFLAWLDNPEERYDHYRRNGGDTTINSLLGLPLDAPVDGIADAQAVKMPFLT